MTDIEHFRKDYPWQVERYLGKDFRYRISRRADSDRTVVIFAGGIGLSDLLFRQFLAFSEHYNVITFDYQKEFRTNVEFADAVAHLLKNLHMKAWLVGPSFGGVIAQIVAELHPEVVEGLVLSNTSSLSLNMSEKAKNGVYKILMGQRKMRAIASLLPFCVYRKLVFKEITHEDRAGLSDDENNILNEFSSILYSGVTKSHTLHMFNFIFDIKNHYGMIREDFSHLDGKVLILLPSNDNTFGDDDIRALIDLMPDPEVDASLEGDRLAMILSYGKFVDKVCAFIDRK